MWGYLPIISVFRRLRQEDCQGLEASLRYIVRSSFETAVTAATVTIATLQSLMGRVQTDRQSSLKVTLLLVRRSLC